MVNPLQDLRYSVRRLARRPGQTAFAILAFGLGIGLVATVYSVVWGTLLRGLPYEGSERLVRVGVVAAGSNNPMKPVPLADFRFLREHQRSFEDLAAWLPLAVSVGDLDLYPEQINGAFVTGNLFDLVGATPVLGRTFAPEEDEGAAVAVVGERLWKRQLGGSRDVLGRTITIYGEPKTIIGVMPEGVRFPYNQELWVSLDATVAESSPWMQVFGRLADGVSLEIATSEMTALGARMAAVGDRDLEIDLERFEATYHDPQVRRSLELAMVAVVGLLLIACANVTNLLLARSAQRARELAIRTALGARRSHLVRQLLQESLLLAAAGGVAGVLLAGAGIDLYKTLGRAPGPYWIDVRLDGAVLALVAAITIVSGVLAGLLPALSSSSPRLQRVLKAQTAGQTAGRRDSRFRKGLVMAQLGLSTGLLVATGLMIDTVLGLEQRFENALAGDVQVMRLGLHGTSLISEPDASRAFFDELDRRLASLPGVERSALATSWPGGSSARHPFELDGAGDVDVAGLQHASWLSVGPGFFDVFDAGVIAGRDFGTGDRHDADPVALVSQSFAEQQGGLELVGRRLRVVSDPARRHDLPWRTIVGVVPDLVGPGGRYGRAEVYVPVAQTSHNSMMAVLRPDPRASGGAVAAAGLERRLREEVKAASPEVPVYFLRPLRELLGAELANPSTTRTLFVVFGASALLLASIGLYGVMALSVGRRRRELGLRMALGALPGDLWRAVLGQGLWQLVGGAVPGTLLAVWLGGTLSSLYGVEPWNLPVLAGVLATLLTAGLAACWIPARRAARVDPMVALRDE